MKKLIILLTFLTSSFFLFNYEVKASELTLDISLDNINDTFFNIKSLSDDFIINNNFDTYIIVYTDDYYIYFFNNSDNLGFNCNIYISDLSCSFYVSSNKYKYDSSSNSLIKTGSTGSNFSSSYYNRVFNNILYSSLAPKFSGSSKDILNLNYNGKLFTVLYDDSIPLVYDLYLLDNPLDNPHKEELEKIDNFYLVLFDRISYFTELFFSNYVFLSLLVIFILIFLFKLIFRRFLC